MNDDDPHVRLQAICSVLRLDRQAVYPVQLIQDLYFAEQSQDFRDRVFDVMDCRDGRLLAAKRMLTDALNSDSGTVNVGEFSFETGRNLKAIRILQAAGQSAVPYVRSTLNDNQTSDRVRERLLRNIASCIPAPHPLRNAVERQLYPTREAVRTSSIRLLQHIGDVNAELVWRIFSDSPPSVDSDMLTAVGASLSRSSTETRPAARVALNQLMKHRSFTVRSQSLRSFQTLFPDDIEAIQAALLFEISKASLTDNDNPWSGWRILSEVISNLRPTPPKVIERITEALDRNDDQSTARIPLLLLGAAGESANTSRIELLSHPQPYVRACVAAQLAATGQASVVPHIKKLLDDRATFSRSLSLHMHFEVEVRLAALEALALEQLASKELVPLFRGHLQHDWSRMEAARGLSHVGPTANAAFPDLVNHEPN